MNLLEKLRLFDVFSEVVILETEKEDFEVVLRDSKVGFTYTENQGQDKYYIFYKED